MRVLVLNHRIPFPPVGGGDLRTYHLVRALTTRHDVTIAGFRFPDDNHPRPPLPVAAIEVPWDWPPLYKEMMYGEDEVSATAYEKLVNEQEEPWFASSMQSPLLEEALGRLTRQDFDLVLIEHTNMGRFLPALPSGVPKVLDLHNVHALMAQREAEEKVGEERAKAVREALRTLRFEKGVVSRCDGCLTVSSAEEAAARALLGARAVHVIPNGVDTKAFRPAEGVAQRPSLLFTGTMNYAPNIDAVVHFTREILPAVRRQVPDVEFHIVGTDPQPEVTRLACQGVVVHGFVPDVRPYYHEAAVVVVPLLRGGGTRLKILEAAACGKAIVSTSLGAEGLDLAPGKDLFVADTPVAFAECIVRLLGDADERTRVGRHACQAVRPYDWQGIGDRFLEVMEGVADVKNLRTRRSCLT